MTSLNPAGLRVLGVAAAIALLPGWLLAGDRGVRASQPAAETVEMFSAIQDGRIDVTLIPKDSKQCNVLIKNKTDKPLSVKLPEAFAGVPVLAQFQGGPGEPPGMGGGGLGSGGGAQAFGGGFGGMGGMMGGMGGMGGMMGGMGGGFFNVPPEKVGKLRITTVCLEHGKSEPRPAVKYQVKPIDQFTEKPEVREVLAMLGNRMIPQRVAQVAAWHLASGMSWQQLAAKQLRFANGAPRGPYFSPQEIRAGMQVVAAAAKRASQRQEDSQEYSLSQR